MRNITVERLQKIRTLTDILTKITSLKKPDKELVKKINELCKSEADDLVNSQ